MCQPRQRALGLLEREGRLLCQRREDERKRERRRRTDERRAEERGGSGMESRRSMLSHWNPMPGNRPPGCTQGNGRNNGPSGSPPPRHRSLCADEPSHTGVPVRTHKSRRRMPFFGLFQTESHSIHFSSSFFFSLFFGPSRPVHTIHILASLKR